MSNLFQEVLNDVNGVQNKYLGPSYPYWQNIKNPADIGMSDNGSLSTLAKDIDGLTQYVEVLVTGNSNASATGRPLGNKFFLNVGGKCIGKDTKKEEDRYIYINNVPQGNIPFVSNGLGTNFKDFRGLIPGTMSNLNRINPFAMMQSFMSGSTPPCQKVTLETIDTKNNHSTETHYVSVVDLQNMDPCDFQGGKNPINGKNCKEAFQSTSVSFPKDPMIQIYYAFLGMIGIYILYSIANKKR
jgi:hypothetical protein